jgi:hypothetical protein
VNDAENRDESRRETSAYPYTSLAAALKIADAVKECGGVRTNVSKGALAAHLGETEKAQGFSQRITSAKSFGLVEGRSDFQLSELAKRIYFPTDESDKSHALLLAFATPATFRQLIERYDGDPLPKKEILANVLHREIGVPESWKDRVASFFLNSAQNIGAINGHGILCFASSLRSNNVKSTPEAPKGTVLSPPVFFGGGVPEEETHTYVLPLANGRKISVTAPLDVTEKEVKRISKWLEVSLLIDEMPDETKP